MLYINKFQYATFLFNAWKLDSLTVPDEPAPEPEVHKGTWRFDIRR